VKINYQASQLTKPRQEMLHNRVICAASDPGIESQQWLFACLSQRTPLW